MTIAEIDERIANFLRPILAYILQLRFRARDKRR